MEDFFVEVVVEEEEEEERLNISIDVLAMKNGQGWAKGNLFTMSV
jgi:hypothetical protein